MSEAKQLPLSPAGPSFCDRTVKSVTFKGNFDYPIHRWFRLTPSFSPELVADILDHWRLKRSARVLEPFCGVGTTLLVCQERGLRSCGIEINPLLYVVARTKITPVEDTSRLSSAARRVVSRAKKLFLRLEALPPESLTKEFDDWIPKIKNVLKWWSTRVLKKLVALRIALADKALAMDVVGLLQMAVVSILIEVSNAQHNHPSLSFGKEPKEDAPVFERFAEQVGMMATDLEAFQKTRPKTQVLQGNAKFLERLLPARTRFEAVITSPPYPNRYSYARETRPQMFYLGLASSGKDVGELETEAIGGTWGKATSVLSEEHTYRSPAVRKALRGIPEEVGKRSNLMGNYIIKYFNDMETHMLSLRPFLTQGARLAYVIGNSKFYEVPLPSDEILGDVFEANGFHVVSTERMRRRNCKSGLYEAVVFVEV